MFVASLISSIAQEERSTDAKVSGSKESVPESVNLPYSSCKQVDIAPKLVVCG